MGRGFRARDRLGVAVLDRPVVQLAFEALDVAFDDGGKRQPTLSDQSNHCPYALHGVYYLKDREIRP